MKISERRGRSGTILVAMTVRWAVGPCWGQTESPSAASPDPRVVPSAISSQQIVENSGFQDGWVVQVGARDADLLSSPPEGDGLAAAAGNLYVTLTNGRVLCLGSSASGRPSRLKEHK